MSDTAVDGLIAAETALIAALDADDIGAIEQAITLFGACFEGLRTPGPWTQVPGVLERLQHAYKLSEEARVRVRYLADRNQQRIDLLAAAAGRFDCAPATYGRPLRKSA